MSDFILIFKDKDNAELRQGITNCPSQEDANKFGNEMAEANNWNLIGADKTVFFCPINELL